jgi:hypothetical protein
MNWKALVSTATLCVAFALAPGTASADMSTGLYCDTPEQVQRFMELKDDGKTVQEAFSMVNVENDKPGNTTWACAFGTIGYKKGDKKAEVTVKEGTIGVYEATVIAIVRNGTMFPIMPPMKQYLPFMDKPTPVKYGKSA